MIDALLTRGPALPNLPHAHHATQHTSAPVADPVRPPTPNPTPLPADRTFGYQYDLAAQECVLCPPGTYQDYANAGEPCKLW